MKVFYHCIPTGNVGDDLNAALWRRFLPDIDSLQTARWLVGAGTILDARLNALEGRKIVMGAGVRPDALHAGLRGDVRIAAVRGLLSAQRLGLNIDSAACDPGFLIDALAPPACTDARRVGLIPHIYTERWSQIADAARDAGFEVVSPTLPLTEFLQRLRRCVRVYAESLHGAIFADALRIPWARVRLCSHYYEGSEVQEFKWRDAFSPFELTPTPALRLTLLPTKRSSPLAQRWQRPAQAALERAVVHALRRRRDDPRLFRLSDAALLQKRTADLRARIEALRSPEAVMRWPCAPTAAAARRQPYALRVLAFPKQGENPFVRAFSSGLERHDAQVDEFSFARAVLRRYDVLHMHWPDSHLRSKSWLRGAGKHARLAAVCLLLRARRTRIVWMMHNLIPHERDHWINARLFGWLLPRLCTHVIALTPGGLLDARSLYPPLRAKPAAVVPHGHYRGLIPQPPPRSACRARLGLPADRRTLLFFGGIRPYKNVQRLIESMRALPGCDAQLVVVGEPALGVKAQDLIEAAQGDERIRLHLRFASDEETSLFMGAAELVVLPFARIQNSGSVLLALSCNRCVLAPRLGSLPELQRIVGSRWLRLYDPPLTAGVLAHALAEPAPAEHEAPDLSAFDWDVIARRTLDFYRRSEPSDDPPAGCMEARAPATARES